MDEGRNVLPHLFTPFESGKMGSVLLMAAEKHT